MNKYMTMIPAYPRAFSALGNVFSHQSIKHLAVNMAYLMTVGVWCKFLLIPFYTLNMFSSVVCYTLYTVNISFLFISNPLTAEVYVLQSI